MVDPYLSAVQEEGGGGGGDGKHILPSPWQTALTDLVEWQSGWVERRKKPCLSCLSTWAVGVGLCPIGACPTPTHIRLVPRTYGGWAWAWPSTYLSTPTSTQGGWGPIETYPTPTTSGWYSECMGVKCELGHLGIRVPRTSTEGGLISVNTTIMRHGWLKKDGWTGWVGSNSAVGSAGGMIQHGWQRQKWQCLAVVKKQTVVVNTDF